MSEQTVYTLGFCALYLVCAIGAFFGAYFGCQQIVITAEVSEEEEKEE